ncbi:hypothetical protein PIB30_094145, partial [Stylosanthes scabra]|nr:hypothetical protein [Stylosanthes scabra]
EEISVYNKGVHDELISSNFHTATYSNDFLPPIPPSKPFPGPNTVEPQPPPPPQLNHHHHHYNIPKDIVCSDYYTHL